MAMSWMLKRLLMAEVENDIEDGTSPITLGTAKDSLDQGYEPFLGFDSHKGGLELAALIVTHGETAPVEHFLIDDDWDKHATCTPLSSGE